MLIAGSVLLIAVLAAFVGYGRYRALVTWRNLMRRSGVTISHDTNGFTYSQSVAGHTMFTLHAAKAHQQSDGTWDLHDASLTLYSRTSPRTDEIYGSRFAYDPKTGVVHALGEVHMDLEAPAALIHAGPPERIGGREGRAPTAAPSPNENVQAIHVRTSGLVYTRSTGIATTQQDVEIEYGNVVAHSVGALFDQHASQVHLLSRVHVDGDWHDTPVTLDATSADLDRVKNVATFVAPVARSNGKTLAAAHAVLLLRKDGSIQQINEDGDVTLTEKTAVVRGDHLMMTLTAQTVPTAATLSGNVTMADSNPLRPMQGAAQNVAASFDAQGHPQIVTATGAVRMAMKVPAVEQVASHPQSSAGAQMLSREMSGDRVVVMLATDDDGKSHLREVHITGHAHAQGESLRAESATAAHMRNTAQQSQVVLTAVGADDLVTEFGDDAGAHPFAKSMNGVGHTVLTESAPDGSRQTSEADVLQVVFAPSAPAPAATQTRASGEINGSGWQVSTADQSGHVTIHALSAAKPGAAPAMTIAHADRADYEGVQQELTLTGGAWLMQNTMQTTADKIVLEQVSGDATATGNVVATLLGNPEQKGARNGQNEESASHVIAERARFLQAAQWAQFFGSDTHPARLWHGASEVEAATLTMDGIAKTLSARPQQPGGMVAAVFAGNASGGGSGNEQGAETHHRAAVPGWKSKRGQKSGAEESSAANIVHVRSPQMDYADLTREAVFRGGVTMLEGESKVTADRAVVFFAPAETHETGNASSASNRAAANASASGTGARPSLAAADPAAASIERAVALGNVHLSEPDRNGSGEELVYLAAQDSFILSGGAGRTAEVRDVEQGTVTGQTLVFGAGDNTIVVAGETVGGKKRRVRTVTHVAQP